MTATPCERLFLRTLHNVLQTKLSHHAPTCVPIQIAAISATLGKVTQVVQITVNKDEFAGEDKEYFAFKESPTAAYADAAGMLSTVDISTGGDAEAAAASRAAVVQLIATKLSPAAMAAEKAAARAKLVQERAEEKAREEAEEGYGDEGEAEEEADGEAKDEA